MKKMAIFRNKMEDIYCTPKEILLKIIEDSTLLKNMVEDQRLEDVLDDIFSLFLIRDINISLLERLYINHYNFKDDELLKLLNSLSFLMSGKLDDIIIFISLYKRHLIKDISNENLLKQIKEIDDDKEKEKWKLVIMYGKMDLFKWLLFNPNKKKPNLDRDINDALITACKYGQIDFVNFLIGKGANVNTKKGICLIEACKIANYEIVKTIIDKIAVNTYGSQAIIEAVGSNSSLQLIDLLRTHWINMFVCESLPLRIACEKGYLDIVKYFFDKYDSIDINYNKGVYLLCAIDGGSLNVVSFLIEKGINIQLENNKALLYACKFNRVDILKLLISKGINIEENFRAIMEIVIFNNSIEILDVLIEENEYNKSIALICSCKLNKIEIAKYLVGKNVNIHYNDDEALYISLQYRHREIFDYLLKIGANINARNGKIKFLYFESRWIIRM